MATLALMAAGSWLGSSLFGSASLLGLSAAQIGATAGAIAGSLVDSVLFGKTVDAAEPDLSLTASTEGAVIPRLYGRQRLAGQIVWATRYTRHEEDAGGGKGMGLRSGTRTYRYSISLAVALCEGPIARVERIWADGNDMDLTAVTWRVHGGTETQEPDPLIETIEGAGNSPAYRGTAYVVFEDLDLESFGNRIPQFRFEVVRAIGTEHADTLETLVRAVTLIPGSGRFVYSTTEVKKTVDGDTTTENKVNPSAETDLVCSLDQMEAVLPQVGSVALVVSWFGTDLRAGVCEVRPGLDATVTTSGTGGGETTAGGSSGSGSSGGSSDTGTATGAGGYTTDWSVGGASVREISQIDGAYAFGATPADASVREGIVELKARGLAVCFYPFLMMDVPAENGLPNPWSPGGAGVGQPVYPWRGRITCHPAPGETGTVDGTAAAATQIAAFFAEYRAMILHYAALCAEAGGVDAFLLGSELVGLTTVRDATGAFPAVAALRSLAAEVRVILGPAAKIGYGADWSEYHSLRPADGSGDVLFPLDDLWADANIDFVGIDNYFPLTDWRDGEDHLDRTPFRAITDRDYLDAGVEGGEYFDWYYASEADRDAQIRTPITDGAHGEPWIYRNKDVRSWWSNAHHVRLGGVRSATATAWVPKSKPIWFTELGCPAIDKGPNQPNVFVDPKSSESFEPYFSNGWRDDLVQRRALEAVLAHWADAAVNPDSDVYAGRMVDVAHVFVWTWDARPFPFFPSSDHWSDGENWRLGHWLTGRAGLAPIELVVADLAARNGLAVDVADLAGLLPGYLIEQIESPRTSIEPIGEIFFFDAVETEGRIVFRKRDRPSVATLDDAAMVPSDTTTEAFELTRAQETDLPLTVRLQYTEAAADYRAASAYGRRRSGASVRETSVSVPFVLEQADAIGMAESLLAVAHVGRETAKFTLPPSRLALDPTDVVTASLAGRSWTLRIGSISDGAARAIEATATDRAIHRVEPGATRPYGGAAGVARAETTTGVPVLAFLDLPLIDGTEAEVGPVLAAYASPWVGCPVYRSRATSGFTLDTLLEKAAVMGVTTAPFARGPVAVWDRANTLAIRLFGSGAVVSAEADAVLAGANLLALETTSGEWELLQFQTATLTAASRYALSGLLRGQCGTEAAMRDTVAAGARVVLITSACLRSTHTVDELGTTYNWRYGPAGSAISDATAFGQIARAIRGIGLRPLSPTALKGRRDPASGDVVFSWIRRTRKGGDSWDVTEVALAEASEAYELDVLDGTTVKRTIAVSSPSATWTAAEQIADFGAAPASVAVAVHQISQSFGRGSPRAATITL